MRVQKFVDVVNQLKKLDDHLRKQKDKKGLELHSLVMKSLDAAIADLEKSV